MANYDNIKDYFGRSASVGDNIIYAGRRGSSMWLTEGVVESVYDHQLWNGTEQRIRVKVTDTDRIATLSNPTYIILRKPWE